MKLKNYKKLVLPTVMAALLVSIPTTSNAYTRYSNTVTVGNSNGSYRVVNNSRNYYVIYTGGSSNSQNSTNKPVVTPPTNTVKPEETPNKPVEKPVEKPQEPTQQPTPAPQPDNGSNAGSNTGSNTGSTSNSKHSLSAAEIKMVELVNKERQAAGLKPLQIDVDLAYVARVKSQDMSDNKYFSHDSPTYGSPFDMMKQFGIKYRGAAENIAKNSSVEAAHNSLMRSSGHKANIMNPNYTHIGIGIVNGYYTQMFISK